MTEEEYQKVEKRLDDVELRLKNVDQQVRAAFIEALRLISKDMHTTSSRPCTTCKFISNVMGEPFGCYEYQSKRMGVSGI